MDANAILSEKSLRVASLGNITKNLFESNIQFFPRANEEVDIAIQFMNIQEGNALNLQFILIFEIISCMNKSKKALLKSNAQILNVCLKRIPKVIWKGRYDVKSI